MHVLIATDAHWASSSAVCVPRPVSTADSRAEKLHVLLPVSIRAICIACMYLIQPSLLSAGFPTKQMPPSNSSSPQIGTALNKQQKKNSSCGVWSKKHGSYYTWSGSISILNEWLHITGRVCNSHMVSTPPIWIGRRQSAVNMLSCENTAVKRRAFAT